jgi:signal transduction histidine kinase
LIENAVKYTETGGKVQIGLALRKDGIEVAVRDTGIGVAPVDQPRLFERFYRASERETRKQPGSGLGLTIVRSIAERHQGKVWFESKLGKGSIFYLLIPLQQGRK